MLRSIFSFFVLVCCLELSGQGEHKITFLFTNDLHSRVTGYAPEQSYTPFTVNDDRTRGGFSRIATILGCEREKCREDSSIVFTVDAGDFLMGTLFQSLETQTGFQLGLMRKMGYDAVAIGNHEFDYGPGRLADILTASSSGEIPAVLLGNAVFSSKDTDDDQLAGLYDKNIIARYLIIERGGIKAGFFSLLGKVADDNAAFAPPVTFSKQAAAARKMVKTLQGAGCDIIVCLSHSGVSLLPGGNTGGEDVVLAGKVKGIDVIISGHSHTVLENPVIVNGVPIVQTGEYGQNVGKLTIALDNGKVSVESYSLIPVDDMIPGDRTIQEMIENQKIAMSKEILEPLGMGYDTPVAESDFLLECNEQGDFKGSNLGPFVADAIQYFVNRHLQTGTDISMVATGVIRDRIVPGLQTPPDIFRIMSMGMGEDRVPGYPLARLYVTGKELRSILEILQVAYKSDPGNYCYYSGLRVEYDPAGGLLKKIKKINIIGRDGKTREVDLSKKNKTLYSVTANAYMLEFVGIIKKMSFGLINVIPKDMMGNKVTDMRSVILDMDEQAPGLQEGKEWLAIIEFIRSMNDRNGNGIPDIDSKYAKPAATFSEVH